MKIKFTCLNKIEVEENDLYRKMDEMGIPVTQQILFVHELKNKEKNIIEKINKEFRF